MAKYYKTVSTMPPTSSPDFVITKEILTALTHSAYSWSVKTI